MTFIIDNEIWIQIQIKIENEIEIVDWNLFNQWDRLAPYHWFTKFNFYRTLTTLTLKLRLNWNNWNWNKRNKFEIREILSDRNSHQNGKKIAIKLN